MLMWKRLDPQISITTWDALISRCLSAADCTDKPVGSDCVQSVPRSCLPSPERLRHDNAYCGIVGQKFKAFLTKNWLYCHANILKRISSKVDIPQRSLFHFWSLDYCHNYTFDHRFIPLLVLDFKNVSF